MPVRIRIIGDESGFFTRVKDAYTPGVRKTHSFLVWDELVKCPGDGRTETGGGISALLHQCDLMAQHSVSLIDGLALLASCILFGGGCAFLFHIVDAVVQELVVLLFE